MSRRRSRALAALLLISVALAAWSFALYARLGIFLVGHRYWLWKAAQAESETATKDSLERVLNATQYGVNQAQTYVRGLDDRQTRIRLWRTLIDLAPNENWVRQYTADLESE